jgi:hypothetical protein
LQDALARAIDRLEVPQIDAELAKLAPKDSLAKLASHGLRGELMFAVPCVLRAEPRLLGYYRLLLGSSQKEFYGAARLGRFKSMEEKGSLKRAQEEELDSLCVGLAGASALLLDGIGAKRIGRELFDDLALLTVGPQLRGGRNVLSGIAGIVKVFDAIEAIVSRSMTNKAPNIIEVKNAAGRRVLIQFASDPDIRIREEMTSTNFRNVIAIEVKAGTDYSNIHNRIGEAEKSHRKARADGYTECWTVVNVDRVNMTMAHRESPSTDRFYRLSQIHGGTGPEYQDFFDRVVALTGIVAAAKPA